MIIIFYYSFGPLNANSDAIFELNDPKDSYFGHLIFLVKLVLLKVKFEFWRLNQDLTENLLQSSK